MRVNLPQRRAMVGRFNHNGSAFVMMRKLLVPVDGSSTSMRGLAEAVSLVKQVKGTLRVLHVVDELFVGDIELATDYCNQSEEEMRARGRAIIREAQIFCSARGVHAETVLVETAGKRAADSIVNQAKQWPADMIVMGTHGRRGMSRLFLGSDAELVLRSAAVPVMLVREHVEATWTPGAAPV